jgi:hypothetical protein
LVEKAGRLVVDKDRAPTVAWLFNRYPDASGVRELVTDLRRQGCLTRRWKTSAGKARGGQPITAAVVRQILSNPLYVSGFVHRGEWIDAQNEPLVSREQWDLVQVTRMKRRIVRDPDRDFLVGILHDEFGRRMGMTTSAPGHGHKPRYYRGIRRGITKDPNKAVLADADKLEVLATSCLKAFLKDKRELREAILSLGYYSDEIGRLFKRGTTSARRVDQMNGMQLRRLFLALVPRAEVTKSQLRLYVDCGELCRFLAWDGRGVFSKSIAEAATERNRVHLVVSQADALCGKRTYKLPIQACPPNVGSPKARVVEILKKGAELEAYVLANRGKSLAELAKSKNLGPSQLSRYIRTNYLAPDIKAAIMDGTEPPELNAWSLFYSPMPLDWAQQRQLFGFG